MLEALSNTLTGLAVSEDAGGIHKIAPSQYGMYVSLGCSLYLRRSSLREKSGAVCTRANAVGQRMQLRGSRWEDRICTHLQSESSKDSLLQYIDCTHEHFESKLRSILTPEPVALEIYMYQATMEIAQEFIPSSLLEVNSTISRIIPDLLKLHRKSTCDPWILMVIDAKSSLKLKQSHQAQV